MWGTVYRIRDVSLFTEYDAVLFERSSTPDTIDLDTLVYDSIHVVYNEKPNIRPAVATQKNYIIPGELFNAANVRRTYRNLSSLSAFNMVDIRFDEVEPRITCLIARC